MVLAASSASPADGAGSRRRAWSSVPLSLAGRPHLNLDAVAEVGEEGGAAVGADVLGVGQDGDGLPAGSGLLWGAGALVGVVAVLLSDDDDDGGGHGGGLGTGQAALLVGWAGPPIDRWRSSRPPRFVLVRCSLDE